jgi:phenylacetic acid degradation operon negative regulatory protein
VSPRASSELDSLLEAEAVSCRRFFARHDGDDADLAATAWDVHGLGRSYEQWLADAAALVATVGAEPPDQDAFVVRSRLVHEWRKFLFKDPGLPQELLPQIWPGQTAAAFFDSSADRLLPGARRYVDACLQVTA